MNDAAPNGHLEVVEFLHHERSEGYDPQALWLAIGRGHLEIVKYFCDTVSPAKTMAWQGKGTLPSTTSLVVFEYLALEAIEYLTVHSNGFWSNARSAVRMARSGHVLIVDYLWGLLVLTRPNQQVKAASTFIDQITSVKNAFKGPWDNELADLPNVVPISEMQVDPDHDNVHDGNVSDVDRATEIDDDAVDHGVDSSDQDEKQVTEAKEDDTADDESHATLEQDIPVTKLAKPLSAYFHFLAANRAIVVTENPGLGIGPVQKILSTKWNELSAEAKEPFATMAAADKERYLNEKQALMDQGIDIEAAPRELFIHFLATKGHDSATISKRKTVKDSDVLTAIHSHAVLDWLRDDFPESKKVPVAAKLSKKSAAHSNVAATEASPSSSSSAKSKITSFFSRD
ncbi:hypothetical protein DYB25_009098 [Aphanomyces astaci]|uniref:HMG box domain-containing protein n=1 Tax=Aphanomyces astaci TaxID=112090 RepID=A0A397AQA7_APHAT|nr:hypothetical protein DYB25_009098 [Aphanomyces astaci]RHY68241.1 hypothetical protein DYB38_004054 [Aphanomyces astaci]